MSYNYPSNRYSEQELRRRELLWGDRPQSAAPKRLLQPPDWRPIALTEDKCARCPCCGNDYLHQHAVEIFSRPGEDAPTAAIAVTNDCEVQQATPANSRTKPIVAPPGAADQLLVRVLRHIR